MLRAPAGVSASASGPDLGQRALPPRQSGPSLRRGGNPAGVPAALQPDLMPVEAVAVAAPASRTLHCHRDGDERRERLASFEALLNDEPAQVHARLRPKTRLDRHRRRNFRV